MLLYNQAAELAPAHTQVKQRLELARLELGDPDSVATPVASDPDAVARLLQQLTGRSAPVTEEDVHRAASLLDEIIHSPHPARSVAQRLAEIDELLPALLELNIRQARADGRPDLARMLQSLLENIQLQIQAGLPDGATVLARGAAAAKTGVKTMPPASPMQVYILRAAEAGTELRMHFVAQALQDLDCEVVFGDRIAAESLNQFDLVVASQPHTDPHLMESLAVCAAVHKPIILDLEADYEQMPVDHPAYENAGLTTPTRAKAYATALLLADFISVPCEALATSLSDQGYPARMIPDGWLESDPAPNTAAKPRHMLSLGWIGTPGELEDVAQVRRMVVRVAREFPNVRLVIGGDPQVYQLFESLPESRRIFLPAVHPDDYPYLLAQMDILLVPLRNTPFNRMVSDRRLLDAGRWGVPWVAPPLPAFQEWGAGGLIANTPDEWHTHLRQLVLDEKLRVSLSWGGKQLAKTRSAAYLGRVWKETLARSFAALKYK